MGGTLRPRRIIWKRRLRQWEHRCPVDLLHPYLRRPTLALHWGWGSWMRRLWLCITCIACAPKVAVQLPASPVIPVQTATFAVVAANRECRPVADALVDELNEMDGIVVDPRSPVRLTVLRCGQPQLPVTVDIRIDGTREERRVTVEGAAHALVSVSVDGVVQGHLLGASRRSAGQDSPGNRPLQLFRTVESELVEGVAIDLAEQIRPIPIWIERPVYARAPAGTPRELYNLAVEAEQLGRLAEARRLAQSAHDRAPNERFSAYLIELDRRIAADPP